MEHPILFLVKLFELFGLGHFAHKYPHVLNSWAIMILLIVFGKLATRNLRMVPQGVQNVFEPIVGGLEDFMIDVTGPKGRPYFPLICTLFLYIFVSNLFGLAPGLLSPTANLNTTLSMALVVFVTFQAVGIKEHGFKYIKHFIGPVWWLAPLMIPIELVGHLARVLSLSFRLFGNLMAEDLVMIILIFLAGKFFAPFPPVLFIHVQRLCAGVHLHHAGPSCISADPWRSPTERLRLIITGRRLAP